MGLPDPKEVPFVGIESAAKFLGIGRTLAYDLARTGRFPVPVLRVGNLFKIPTKALLDRAGFGTA